MIRFFIILIGITVISQNAQASALRPTPECALSISIDHQEKGLLNGTIEESNSQSPYSDTYCLTFKDKKVKITGGSGYPEIMLEVVQSVTLGVQRFSSMGENGVVEGTHWDVLGMIEAAKTVPKHVLPHVEIEIIPE